ncbi:hypothetical protein [Streptacidiphilus cavernicola]|uniref:Helix-turn-helix domain-containing protein n=1 Tax=Streptacidiphilus cavernicola TaxID=3342716 RepID=A0ABV6VYD2_9ACTN
MSRAKEPKFDPDEVAERYGIDRDTAVRWIDKGLSSKEIAKVFKVTDVAVRKWINADDFGDPSTPRGPGVRAALWRLAGVVKVGVDTGRLDKDTGKATRTEKGPGRWVPNVDPERFDDKGRKLLFTPAVAEMFGVTTKAVDGWHAAAKKGDGDFPVAEEKHYMLYRPAWPYEVLLEWGWATGRISRIDNSPIVLAGKNRS